MEKGNLTLIFNHFEFGEEHIDKDVFQIPYTLGKLNNYKVSIVYPELDTNLDFPKSINNVKLIALKYKNNITTPKIFKHVAFYLYLLKNAKNIDVLVRFHLSIHTELMTILYKILNKSGKVYVKLDINPSALDSMFIVKKKTIKSRIHKLISKLFINLTNVFSVESTEAYNLIKKSSYPQLQFGEKLRIVRNGFNEEHLKKIKLKEKNFLEKENLIITVGRLGTYQKNTEMLLEALCNIDLKDWKVYFIGTIDKKFEPYLNNFYLNYKYNNITFTGPIKEKNILYEYYNRSKIFVLTSVWEGYPIVFPEAKRFRNFILSTNISACSDITENGKYGICIPQNNSKNLGHLLSEIINGKIDINVYKNYDISNLTWETQLKEIKI